MPTLSASQLKQPARRKVFTVSGQLATVVVASLGIAFLVVTGVEIERSRSFFYEIELHHNVHTTRLIAGQLYGPVRWRRPGIIEKSYEALVAHGDLSIVAAVTLDRDGEVLTAYQDPASSVDLRAVLRSGGLSLGDHEVSTRETDDVFIVVAPVLSHDGSQQAGTFALAWSTASLRQATVDEMTRDALVALVTLAVFMTLAMVFVRIRLGRPLADITEATNRIANGDKRFPVPWTQRADEIGDMARSLVTFRENVALIDRLTAEQQQQTMRLSEALEKEREYNALHREFVSMVSHEFRTPVAIIDGAAQRIDRRAGRDTPEELRRRTAKIRSAVRRMIELIDSTLSLSRIEAGAIDLELEQCDLAALLREICQRQQEIAERHKISLTIADLPSSMRCDSMRLDQVFTNLLSNAVKYSPDSPRIDVKAGMIGGKVVVSVRDHGLGIPKDELPKLFGKFFRASTSTGIPGTGIGLHLVRHLVELHGGTATIDSVEGQGTTVSVTLPIAAEDRPAEGELAAHAVSEPVTA